MSENRSGIVENYLTCMAAHDWDGLAATLAEDGLVREGPFCDVVEGKERYVAFLRDVLTSLKGYRLDVRRISHVSDEISYVEVSETVRVGSSSTEYPECILFERNSDGLIRRVSVFIKQPAGVSAS